MAASIAVITGSRSVVSSAGNASLAISLSNDVFKMTDKNDAAGGSVVSFAREGLIAAEYGTALLDEADVDASVTSVAGTTVSSTAD